MMDNKDEGVSGSGYQGVKPERTGMEPCIPLDVALAGYYTRQAHQKAVAWVPNHCPNCNSANISKEVSLAPGSSEIALTCRGCNQEVLVWVKHPGA